MVKLFDGTCCNDEIDNAKYQRLKRQVQLHYGDDVQSQSILMEQINRLQYLEQRYPSKASISTAYTILDNISRKSFGHLNHDIARLQVQASEDIKEFSLMKSIIAFLLLPILLPFMLLDVAINMLIAYQYMILAETLLISLVVATTLVCLEPLFLLATIPAALVIGHFLAEIVLDSVMENMMYNASNAFNAFFYDEDTDLKNSIEEVISTATDTRNKVEGSPIS